MTFHTKDKKTIKSNYFRFHKNLYAIKMISKTSVIWFCFDCRSRQLCQRHSSGIWSTLPIMLSCVYWANGQLDIIIRQINESMQYGVILKTCMNIWLELKPWNTINSILVKGFLKKNLSVSPEWKVGWDYQQQHWTARSSPGSDFASPRIPRLENLEGFEVVIAKLSQSICGMLTIYLVCWPYFCDCELWFKEKQ